MIKSNEFFGLFFDLFGVKGFRKPHVEGKKPHNKYTIPQKHKLPNPQRW
jgi:hypothetical protein